MGALDNACKALAEQQQFCLQAQAERDEAVDLLRAILPFAKQGHCCWCRAGYLSVLVWGHKENCPWTHIKNWLATHDKKEKGDVDDI